MIYQAKKNSDGGDCRRCKGCCINSCCLYLLPFPGLSLVAILFLCLLFAFSGLFPLGAAFAFLVLVLVLMTFGTLGLIALTANLARTTTLSAAFACMHRG